MNNKCSLLDLKLYLNRMGIKFSTDSDGTFHIYGNIELNPNTLQILEVPEFVTDRPVRPQPIIILPDLCHIHGFLYIQGIRNFKFPDSLVVDDFIGLKACNDFIFGNSLEADMISFNSSYSTDSAGSLPKHTVLNSIEVLQSIVGTGMNHYINVFGIKSDSTISDLSQLQDSDYDVKLRYSFPIVMKGTDQYLVLDNKLYLMGSDGFIVDKNKVFEALLLHKFEPRLWVSILHRLGIPLPKLI